MCVGSSARQRQSGARASGTLALRNKPPKWNPQLGAYCLNFKGRVTQPSVKNFQLVSEHDLDTVLLQFGKVRRCTCVLDLKFAYVHHGWAKPWLLEHMSLVV